MGKNLAGEIKSFYLCNGFRNEIENSDRNKKKIIITA